MTLMTYTKIVCTLIASTSLLSTQAAVVVVNGDFETGDLSGWINNASASIVSGASALEGNHSLFMPGGAGGNEFRQTFSPVKGVFTVSFLFRLPTRGRTRTAA